MQSLLNNKGRTWDTSKHSQVCRQLLQRLCVPLLMQQQHHGLKVHHLCNSSNLCMTLAADSGSTQWHCLQGCSSSLVGCDGTWPVLPELCKHSKLRAAATATAGATARHNHSTAQHRVAKDS